MTVKIDDNAYLKAAIMAGESAAMDRGAATLLRNIKAEAVRHNLTGAFYESWEVRRARGESGTGTRVTDRVVVSTDPGALAINYGHLAKPKGDGGGGEFVEGKHVVEKAIARSSG